MVWIVEKVGMLGKSDNQWNGNILTNHYEVGYIKYMCATRVPSIVLNLNLTFRGVKLFLLKFLDYFLPACVDEIPPEP